MWWQLGRWDTVDDMLEALTPPEIAWARAAYETVPLSSGWKQADTIAGAIHNEMEVFMTAKAGKRRVDKSRMHKPGEYIPKLRPKKRTAYNLASIDNYHAIIQAQYANGQPR